MTVAILSDIHYAGPAERARGENYELRVIANPLLRAVARAYRHMIWMRHPFVQERQLERFLAEVENRPVDFLVANGDYSCDSAFGALGTRRHSKARSNVSTSSAKNSATGLGSLLATTNWEN